MSGGTKATVATGWDEGAHYMIAWLYPGNSRAHLLDYPSSFMSTNDWETRYEITVAQMLIGMA
jgi:hypothetical protein